MTQRTCFLVAPIGPQGSEVRRRSDRLYEHVVRPAVEAVGYTVFRADMISAPGAITTQIITHIVNDELVIADLSGLNPNVMYELGIRHAVGRPVIQLTSIGEPLPFDVSSVRTIIYDLSDLESVATARETLVRFVAALDTGEFQYDSPVSIAATLTELARSDRRPVSDDDAIMTQLLRSIDGRLSAVEQWVAPKPLTQEAPQFSRRIFIIHGHDAVLKNELARLLERLDFVPVILHEQPDRGQTILTKLNAELADVGFAFVILTPDDVGNVASDATALKARARQNVVFEHGLFSGRLSQSRVCAIRRGDVEIPSDLHGLLYKTVPVGSGIDAIAFDVVKELRAAGYIVDANRLVL